jgi:hypothetical protein
MSLKDLGAVLTEADLEEAVKELQSAVKLDCRH